MTEASTGPLIASNATLISFVNGEFFRLSRSGALTRFGWEEFLRIYQADRKVAAYRTSFEERCRAAAAAGFAGISVSAAWYFGDAEERLADAASIRTHGLKVTSIDNGLNSWHNPAPEIEKGWLEHEELIYAMAEAFGSGRMSVIAGSVYDPPLDRSTIAEVVAPRFAALCQRASRRGLSVGLEFVAGTACATPAAAWDLVELSRADNAGLIVDSFSFFNGGGTYEQLRAIPPERIYAVQLSDGTVNPTRPLYQEALRSRELPGRGDFDLVSFVQVLDEMGVSADYEVEIFNDLHWALPIEQAAQEAYAATTALLRKARR